MIRLRAASMAVPDNTASPRVSTEQLATVAMVPPRLIGRSIAGTMSSSEQQSQWIDRA